MSTFTKVKLDGVEYDLGGGGLSAAVEDKTLILDDAGTESNPYLVAGNYEYSEEEKIVGKWINGKPLYEKTYKFIATTEFQELDISDLNCELINDFEITNLYDETGSQYLGNFYWTSSDSFSLHRVGDILMIDNRYSNLIGGTINLTLKYTKTTDAENSFKPSMLSTVEMPIKHKYSTEEKIVGEWIDGKPIYEKTLDEFTIESTSALTEIYEGIENLLDSTLLFICPDGQSYTNKLGRGHISDGNFSANISFKNNKVYLERSSADGWSGWKARIIIQYTKITD